MKVNFKVCVLQVALLLASLSGVHNTIFVSRTVKESKALPVAVLIPTYEEDGGCTKRIIEKAIQEITEQDILYGTNITEYFDPDKNETVRVNITSRYYIDPFFKEIENSYPDTLEKMYHLFSTPPRKTILIGAPHKEQATAVFDYALEYRFIQFSYSVADIPFRYSLEHNIQIPNFLNASFEAAVRLFTDSNWREYSVVLDLDSPSHESNNEILEYMINQRFGLNGTTLLARSAFFSFKSEKENADTFETLIQTNSRIIFGLFGVAGARKMFCWAYKSKMYQKRIIWLIFEKLPPDWASDKYNSLTTANGETQRDVSCTEEELLIAADGYIVFTNTLFRKDEMRRMVNGKAVGQFLKELKDIQKASGNKCKAYTTEVYDTVWTFAKTYALFGKTRDYLDYNWMDRGLTEISRVFSKQVIDTTASVEFEGITGPVAFSTPQTFRQYINPVWRTRGFVDIFVFHKSVKFVATYDYGNDRIRYEPNTKIMLFGGNGIVPRDRALMAFIDVNFNFTLFVTLWVLAYVGIVLTVIYLIVYITSLRKNDKEGNCEGSFNAFVVIGCVLCYLSVILYGVDGRFIHVEDTSKICYAFLATLMTGFSFIFGSLFSKIWLLYKRRMAPQCKIQKMHGLKVLPVPVRVTIFEIRVQCRLKNYPDWIIFAFVGGMLACDIIILVTLATKSPLTFNRTTASQSYNPNTDTNEFGQIVTCACAKQTEFKIAIYSYKALFLLFGVFFSLQLRSLQQCKDLRKGNLEIAIYNVASLSVVGGICVTALSNTTNNQATYAVIAVCVLVGTTATFLLIFWRSIYSLLSTEAKEVYHTTSSPKLQNAKPTTQSLSVKTPEKSMHPTSMEMAKARQKSLSFSLSYLSTSNPNIAAEDFGPNSVTRDGILQSNGIYVGEEMSEEDLEETSERELQEHIRKHAEAV